MGLGAETTEDKESGAAGSVGWGYQLSFSSSVLVCHMAHFILC